MKPMKLYDPYAFNVFIDLLKSNTHAYLVAPRLQEIWKIQILKSPRIE